MLKRKSLLREAPEDPSKAFLQEIRELDERISKEEMELLEKKQNLEEMMKEKRNAKVEEGREELTAKSDVTQMAVNGSRISDSEAELLSADVEDRSLTEDLPVISHRRQWRLSAHNEVGRKVSSVDEEVN